MTNIIFSDNGGGRSGDFTIPGVNKMYKPSAGKWKNYLDVTGDNTTTASTGYIYYMVKSSIVTNPKIWFWNPSIVKALITINNVS